ncbi:MAG: transcriptional regulator, partial [Proteobacteria bacterium]|nr:transcriptional regulator [Pseudomonadota bacterium]
MMPESSLISLIQQGENVCLEFISSEAKADSIAREIVSFANKDGGTLLLGVLDDGQIGGLPGEKNYEEWVANIARNNVIPAIDLTFSISIIQNGRIGVIGIPKGRDKPYQTTDGKYWIRVGSTNRIATQAELLRLFQASGFYHYDLTPVYQTGLRDLNFSKLDNYFQRYKVSFSRETDEQKTILLRNVDILTESGQATVAGMLVFG